MCLSALNFVLIFLTACLLQLSLYKRWKAWSAFLLGFGFILLFGGLEFFWGRCLASNDLHMVLRKIYFLGNTASGKEFSSSDSGCYVVTGVEKYLSVNLGKNGSMNALL